ncbi:PREDICTED: DEAD-box ATP-dependent RNA helicase 42 isoform X2 [Camelina sativa]|uniref:DEAD-box ATP-dependent RNA helicase 42 isoform X2 n=1 Tax=Camelina sativa TaxID=90675 RepID=A0ABM0ZIP2_CAMSA|nr:PREDICTED: DEAD-box ATP-dependent RNA helicase 42 isoform X2 [Camelina sativa]
MDTELNSPPHHDDGYGDGDTTAAFRKPSNDGASRKYRRRALADDGSSSSDGSPERNQSSDSRGNIRKDSEPLHSRKEDRRESDRSRYGRGDSHKHERYSRDDDNYCSKREGYSRYERDAPRSSRDSRGGRHIDRTGVETELSRSRIDSDRHSRDKYSNFGHRVNSNDKVEDLSSRWRYADSRVEGKEKGFVRGRDFLDEKREKGFVRGRDLQDEKRETGFVRGRDLQDEKRDSRWSFGDRYSRDERKEHGNPEISKEKDVHVKSPRDRPDVKCLATENRDTHSKKLKGFISEKFTHGSSNEEKQTSIIKPSPSDVDAAKVAAMQAAELVNKNLVGTGYLTTDQKKKLLWGKKKSTTAEESAHRWDSASALIGDPERQEKFNKLMGVKASTVNQEQNLSEVEVEKQKELQMDLEKQYTAGLRRRDGRTVGLGL